MKVRLATYPLGVDERGYRSRRVRLRAGEHKEREPWHSDDVWILGIHMTKFGKHPDKDVVDLAAEAAMGALADGGVTIKDIGVMAAGNLMPATPASARSSRSRSARPGSRCTTWPTPAPPGPPRCARPSWPSRRARSTWAWPSGWRSWPAPDCWPEAPPATTRKTWTPKGRYGAVAPVDGRIGTETMPGVFAQIGMEYGHRYGGHQLRALRPHLGEEPRPLDAEPAGRLPRSG